MHSRAEGFVTAAAVAAWFALTLGLAGCAASRSLPVENPSHPAPEDEQPTFRPPPPAARVALGDALADVEARLVGYDLLERFALVNPSGRRTDYLALRAGGDIPSPALLFENGRLVKILDRSARRTFLACRLLASSRGRNWMHDGIDRYRLLLDDSDRRAVRVAPLEDDRSVQTLLVDTTMQGLSLVQDVTSLIPSGLSPSGLTGSVRSIYRSNKERNQAQARFDVLRRFPLGMKETAFVESVGVDWARVEGGSPVLWYRDVGFEVLIRDRKVAGVGFPATYERTEGRPGGYYEPGVDWSRCPG